MSNASSSSSIHPHIIQKTACRIDYDSVSGFSRNAKIEGEAIWFFAFPGKLQIFEMTIAQSAVGNFRIAMRQKRSVIFPQISFGRKDSCPNPQRNSVEVWTTVFLPTLCNFITKSAAFVCLLFRWGENQSAEGPFLMNYWKRQLQKGPFLFN